MPGATQRSINFLMFTFSLGKSDLVEQSDWASTAIKHLSFEISHPLNVQ